MAQQRNTTSKFQNQKKNSFLKIRVIFYHNSQEQPPPANPLPHPVFRRMRSISLSSSSDPQLHPARLPALDISHVIYHKAASEIKHLHLFRALTFQYTKTTSESKINGIYQPFWSKILQETLQLDIDLQPCENPHVYVIETKERLRHPQLFYQCTFKIATLAL